MTKLGRCVDELELDLLVRSAAGPCHKGLAQGDQTLLGAAHLALKHDVILHDLTIVGETTHWCDALDSQIEVCGGVVLLDGLVCLTGSGANPVHLLVELCTMVVTVLARRATVNLTRDGCHEPMQATLRRPLWVLRGSFVTPQRVTTPSYPLPLVMAMVSIISFCSKTVSMETGFSKRSFAN